ncbi:MBL fold metallo-hydrolase [Sciscionella sediminilitoris]|uniref:MBL fold metallo-hydrolase n=1 Tax=Sciscionella sediminilitoris TaxID=1445613 RepID=UPI0004DF3414|nr:MBL fold metallo-hydrolase [Sciscionella sp. SE31]
MTGHPAYAEPREVTEFATVVLQRNPGVMTLDGTNSLVLRAPGSAASVVVDPGEPDPAHLDVLAEAAGAVELVLITHHHPDHYGAAAEFADRVGAPVRAFDAELCLGGGTALGDGERVDAAGLDIEVLHTPGHTHDSVSFVVHRASGPVVLTGDTILGKGTTVIDSLGDYLGSLRRLADTPSAAIGLPGHGPELGDIAETAREYLEHREQRLDQVRGALAVLGPEASARQVVEHVYVDVDRSLWPAAEHSVRAQLEYLRGA